MASVSTSGTKQIVVTGDNGLNYTPLCTFSSSNEAKATVNGSGLVSGVAAGSATITATYLPAGADTPLSGTISFTVS